MAPRHTESAFFNRPAGRKLLFASLYLSEGAPIGFIWWALPTRLRAAGVAVDEITALTSVLILPWMFKFAWAPLVDTLRTRHWNLPAWIVSTQLAMGASLLPLAFSEIGLALILPLLLFHAVVAATQDASIDALSIAIVPEGERGKINGWMQAGMLAGRGFFGGGALLLEESIGADGVILLLVGVIWCSTVLVMVARQQVDLPPAGEKLRVRWMTFVETLKSAASSKVTWLGLGFAAVGGAGFEAVGAVAGPFLIDRGFSQREVGWFFGIPVVAGMMVGALAGGYIADKIGRTRAVAIFLISLAVTIFAIAATDASFNPAHTTLLILLAVLYLFIGMFTASSYALFMDIADRRLGATQFSAYMGATNGCESWAAFAAGRMIAAAGYPVAFAVMAGLSLLAVPLLKVLRRPPAA